MSDSIRSNVPMGQTSEPSVDSDPRLAETTHLPTDSKAESGRNEGTNRNPEIELPDVFGRYQIQRRLGNGSMGCVFLAEDTQLRRPVALKVPRLTNTVPELLERFYQEARSAATLTHPNICPIYDVGEEQGIHFISMAYIDGKSLAEVLRNSALSDSQVVNLVRKLALALDEAHRKNVIHRDIKPANIVVDQRGEPILMDFGLARQYGVEGDARLTREGVIVGSPAYMSPEQVQGDTDLGPASDIYSLGVVLFEMLTGRLPFQGTVTSIIGQILHVEPPRIRELRPDCPEILAAVAHRAMQKKPQSRFGSMAEFAAALSEGLNGTPGQRDSASMANTATLAWSQNPDQLIPQPTRAISRTGPSTRHLIVAGMVLAAAFLFYTGIVQNRRHPSHPGFGQNGDQPPAGFIPPEEVAKLAPEDAFAKLDTDGDLKLSSKELLPHILARADADSDHFVSWDEYAAAVEKWGTALHDPPGRNERPPGFNFGDR